MAFYRIKLFTDKEKHKDDKEYCLKEEHPLVGIGWGNENCLDINTYVSKIAPKTADEDRNFRYPYDCISNMSDEDYVWTKIDGLKYALGKIEGDLFIDKERPRMGAVRVCKWKNIDFDDVPGKITNYFVGGGRTLVKMDISKSLEEYCKWLYRGKTGVVDNINLNDLIHYDDLEDLLGLYLQSKGYYIYPSTNKLASKLIEFELIHKDTRERACIQCKTGNDIVGNEIFEKFKDYEIFISTTMDKNYNDKKSEGGKGVTTVYTNELWDWAYKNFNLLPKRIQKYISIVNR